MLELLKKLAPHKFPGYNDLGKDDSAPAPVYVPTPVTDYTAAAEATAEQNLENARVATKANRVNQYTPYGNTVYTDLGNDRWRADVTLTPAQQQILDKDNAVKIGLSDVSQRGLGYVQNMLNNPFSTSGMTTVNPADNAGRNEVIAAMLERQQPAMDRKRQQAETALLVQGHNRGGEAWKAVEDDLNRGETDMRLAAELAGGQEQSRLFGLGSSARERELQERSFLRNEPLNTLNAVRSGSQVVQPTFSPVPAMASTPGANYSGALSAAQGDRQAQYSSQLAAYNANQAQNSNMMSGLFGLGAAALPYFL